MSPKPENLLSHGRPKTPEERLAWVLSVMIESSGVREEHFKYRDSWNRKFVQTKVKYDSSTGIPVDNQHIYGALHADYIFFVMGVIESFQGALATAWELTSKQPDPEKMLEIVVNPTKYRGVIQGVIRNLPIREDVLCRLVAIPLLKSFSEEVELRALMKPALERVAICACYSQRYWNIFKAVRNVYAHNFRFIFYDGVKPIGKPEFDQWVIGHLEVSSNLTSNSVLIGGHQRIAMGELGFMLGSMERWIYQNIRNAILSGGKPTLPLMVPHLNKKERNEYERIRTKQGYRIRDPVQVEYSIADLRDQLMLNLKFIEKLKEWGHSLTIVDQHGNLEKLNRGLDTRRKEFRDKRRPKRGRKSP